MQILLLKHLQQASSQAVWQAEHRLDEGIARHAAGSEGVQQQAVTLAEIRQDDDWSAGLNGVALILQALTWAIALPRQERGTIA